MAKLFRILVASVGGGLVLGAGIRLGEAITARDSSSNAGNTQELARKLGEIESRLTNLESESAPGLSAVTPHEPPTQLREWLDETVGFRMAEVENRLRSESERAQKQILEVFVESVQTRVVQRISRLEEEFASQSAAMTELRECSLRTERSMQKLLGGLDRLIVPPGPRATAPDPKLSDKP